MRKGVFLLYKERHGIPLRTSLIRRLPKSSVDGM